MSRAWVDRGVVTAAGILVLAAVASIGACASSGKPAVSADPDLQFSGSEAMAALVAQVEFGPRPTGSEANARLRDWLEARLDDAGWQVRRHGFHAAGPVSGENVVGWRGEGRTVMLGAHFDTRLHSDRDQDPSLRETPGPGANDGASGVAVLLELARVLKPEDLGLRICLAFFDAEDNGDIGDWDWALGASSLAGEPEAVPACGHPSAMVVVDMVGDADLKIYRDFGSTETLQRAIWNQAEALGFGQFNFARRYYIYDDHAPFREAGVPALVIIDFEYPWWHTTGDTLDKVGAESLRAVGATLEAWIESGALF